METLTCPQVSSSIHLLYDCFVCIAESDCWLQASLWVAFNFDVKWNLKAKHAFLKQGMMWSPERFLVPFLLWSSTSHSNESKRQLITNYLSQNMKSQHLKLKTQGTTTNVNFSAAQNLSYLLNLFIHLLPWLFFLSRKTDFKLNYFSLFFELLK
jgi:hypothetical protein